MACCNAYPPVAAHAPLTMWEARVKHQQLVEVCGHELHELVPLQALAGIKALHACRSARRGADEVLRERGLLGW